MKNAITYFAAFLLISLFVSSCETHDLTEKGLLVPLTVMEDPSLPSIYVNGAHFHSEAFGDPNDPMVVTIHGGPGVDYLSIMNFKDLAGHGLYVVFYDQRGSGLSQRFDVDFWEEQKVQIFMDDLHAVIDHYRSSKDQKLILAGHSWGAMMVAGYLNQHINEVDGVIMAEPGGFDWDMTMEYISRSWNINVFSERTNDATYLDQFITGDDHETLDYMQTLWASTEAVGDEGSAPMWRSGAVIFNWANEYASEHPEELDFTANLEKYSAKVLFAYSSENEAYGRDHAEKVAAEFPHVQLEEIPDCGHEIIHFGWEHFYPVTLDYIHEILNQ